MRRTIAILFFLAGLATAPLIAQGIDPAQEQYVNAFLNSRKAEELEGSGKLREALTTFRNVADTLVRLKQVNPDYQPEMREWRLKRTLEAIDRVQGKLGGPAAEPGPGPANAGDLGVLPPLPSDNPLEASAHPAPVVPEPVRPKVSGAKPPKKPIVKVDDSDPLAPVKNRIATLEAQLSEAQEQLADSQAKNAELSQNLSEAVSTRNKAEADRKKAQDLSELYQKNVLDLKSRGDNTGERAKELEAQLAMAKKQNEVRDAELRAAEERIDQLLARSRAVAKKAEEAGSLPKEMKSLQAKLEAEMKAKTELDSKLAGVTKERDDARAEITRLKDLNKQADRLMADNTALLKKLGEAEKQILAFRTDAPKKDEEIASLRTQVTDAQKALNKSQEKNTSLQAELGTVQKKVDEYTKQIQQYKTDKTASVEEKRRMEEENKLLQGIVMRVLQEDANRSSKRKIVQKELDRLQIQSDVLLTQVGMLTQPVVNLTREERRLFKKPELVVQDSNTLVAFKSDNSATTDKPADAKLPEPEKSTEVAPSGTPPVEPAANGTPEKSAEPEKTPSAAEMAKLSNPAKPELPGKEPGTTEEKPVEPKDANTSANAARVLPEEVKAIADQAKQAFDREKYTDSEKFYDKALQAAPTNLYLLSNKAVVQFRMGKLKQAEETFRKALAIAPEDHFCWGTLGIVQYSQNKYDDAVNSLTKSLAINPRNPTAHNYLGITAAQKGWLEAAEKELVTATQLDPRYADAWFNLAVTHTLKQPPNKDEGRKAYKKALELGADADPAMENSLK